MYPQARPAGGTFHRDGEAARPAQRLFGKAAGQYSRRGGVCPRRRLGIVGPIPDHHSLAPGEAQLSQRDTHDARVRFPVFDIVAAGGGLDKLIDVKEGQVMLELRSLAVSRKSEPAATVGELTDPTERLDAVKILS